MKKISILLSVLIIAAMLLLSVSAEESAADRSESTGETADPVGGSLSFGSGEAIVSGDGTHIVITVPDGSENTVELDGDRVTAAGSGSFDFSISPEMKDDISRILEDGIDNLDKEKVDSFIGKYGDEIVAEYGAGVVNDIISKLDYDTVNGFLSKLGIDLGLITGIVIGAAVFVILLLIAVIVLTILLITTRKKLKKLKASACKTAADRA